VLAAVGVGACRQVAGASLGLFFGGAGVATAVVPPLVAAVGRGGGRGAAWAMVPIAAALGAAVVWMFTPAEALTWGQWLACGAVLAAYGMALGGGVAAAVALRAVRPLAAGVVTILGLLWLTWPVWLSHALLKSAGDTLVAWLVPAHPLFAINGVLIHFDAWDRLPLAYTRLSNLNQDVFYKLPDNVLPAVIVHSLIGLACGAVAMLIERRGRRKVSSASSPVEASAGGAPAGR
jgi:hypothetical protein